MTVRILSAVSALALLAGTASAQSLAEQGPERGEEWREIGRAELAERLERPRREGRARNVILFVVDGMGLSTVTAGRIFEGQMQGGMGEDHYLPFERWGHSATVKTYTDNAQVADSAATATALQAGIKSHNGAISVYPRQTLESCAPDAALPATIMQLAEERGMSTGTVVTARLTHATPAAGFAHVPHRGWESDADLPAEAVEAGCRDIARQLVEFSHGDGVDVAIGGGLAAFTPEDQGGNRTDGRDLTAEWVEAGGVFVSNAEELRALDPSSGERVLGLLNRSHLAFEHDRDDAEEPSLAEMTRFAIESLSTNENGYYLMVEAGRVDHAHHGVNAYRAMTDMVALADAVRAAEEMTDPDETLMIVTADHSHVFTIAGYPRRGNPLLGLMRPPAPNLGDDPTPPSPAQDGRPYTTVGYYAGPVQRPRSEDAAPLTDEQVQDPDYRQEAAIPLAVEPHGGEDVIAYALGPWAHLVDGVMEQHTLFHIMTHAYGWDREDGAE